MFRTQLVSTISAARLNPALTFWAADASSTTPAPLQAYVGSLQPNRQARRPVIEQGRNNHGQEGQTNALRRTGHGRSLCGERFRPPAILECSDHHLPRLL